MIKRIFNIILILLFIIWFYMIISDYVKVKDGSKAVFCVRHTLYDYVDGSVEECLGIGYKVYYYDRDSINVSTDFGPFWIKIRD